jgi:zinc protease
MRRGWAIFGCVLIVACTDAGVRTERAERLDTTAPDGSNPDDTSPDDTTPDAPGDTLDPDPAVRTFTLDNGLTVHIRQNNRPGSSAEMRLAIRAGSAMEEPDQSGVAHFLEHMLFNGTEKFPANELIEQLRSFGMEFGADVNAYTSYDETVYELAVPLTDPGNLDVGIDILGEWLDAALIDPDQVIAERGVVLDEYRTRELSRQGRVFDALDAMFLDGTGYEGRAPIGTDAAIEAMTEEPLRRFYDRWYRPDNAAVIVVGDIDVDEVEALVRARFEGIAPPGDAAQRPDLTVPDPSEPEVAVVPDPDAQNADVEITWPLGAAIEEPTTTSIADDVVLDLAFEIVAQRLSDDISSGTSTFTEAYVSNNEFTRSLDAPSVVLSAESESLDDAVEALIVEFERAERFGFDDNELNRAVGALRADAQAAFDSRDTVQDRVHAENLVEHFLGLQPIPTADDQFELITSILDQVTADDVAGAISERIDASAAHLFVGFPDTLASPPTEGELLDQLAAVDDLEIEPRAESAPPVTQLMDPPDPVEEQDSATVASRPEQFLEPTALTFPNGATVILNQTTIVDDRLVFAAVSVGGMSLVADADVGVALIAPDVITSSGAGALDQVAVDTVLSGTTAELTPFIEQAEEGFFGGGSADDLETLLQLFHLYIDQPRVDAVALEAVRRSYEPIVDDPLADPDWAPYVALADARYGGARRNALLPTPEELAAVDVAAVERVWRSRFSNASDWVVVLSGDFAVGDATELARRYVGTLDGSGSTEQFANVEPLPPPGIVQRTVNAGTGDTGSVIRLYTGASPADGLENVYSDMLGNVLDTRLTDHIREELGASYSPFAGVNIYDAPFASAETYIEVTGDPAGLPELSVVLNDDLTDLATNGPSDSEFQTALSTFGEEYQYFNNNTLAFTLAYNHWRPTELDEFIMRTELLDSVTREGFAEFVARALPSGQFIEILNLPA